MSLCWLLLPDKEILRLVCDQVVSTRALGASTIMKPWGTQASLHSKQIPSVKVLSQAAQLPSSTMRVQRPSLLLTAQAPGVLVLHIPSAPPHPRIPRRKLQSPQLSVSPSCFLSVLRKLLVLLVPSMSLTPHSSLSRSGTPEPPPSDNAR